MSDYQKQLKNLTFDCSDPSKIYASTNKYYFIVQKQCSDSPDGEFETEASLPVVYLTGITKDASYLTIPYQGTFIFTGGSASQYLPITVTLSDRDDYIFRKYLLKWQYDIHNASSTSNNLRRIVLLIYNHDNTFQKSYTFEYAFPDLIDVISLSWEAVNTSSVYNVSFSYAYSTEIDVESDIPSLNDLLAYSDPQVLSVIPPRE